MCSPGAVPLYIHPPPPVPVMCALTGSGCMLPAGRCVFPRSCGWQPFSQTSPEGAGSCRAALSAAASPAPSPPQSPSGGAARRRQAGRGGRRRGLLVPINEGGGIDRVERRGAGGLAGGDRFPRRSTRSFIKVGGRGAHRRTSPGRLPLRRPPPSPRSGRAARLGGSAARAASGGEERQRGLMQLPG